MLFQSKKIVILFFTSLCCLLPLDNNYVLNQQAQWCTYASSLKTPITKTIITCACILCPLVGGYLLFKKLSTQDKNQWSKITEKDLAFAYKQIKEHHPGPVNLEDPAFNSNLETYYQEALTKATHVQNESDYWRIIKKFFHQFNDTHVRIFPFNRILTGKAASKNFELPSCTCYHNTTAFIRLPSFDLEYAPSGTKNALEAIIKTMPSLRNVKTIVFDVHNNGGGNSTWGYRILSGLFSEEYVDQRQLDIPPINVDFRVSVDNLAHWKAHTQLTLDTFGETGSYHYFKIVCALMEDALKKNLNLVRGPQESRPTLLHPVNDPVKAHIVIIINKKCVSATLDFIDMVKSLNHPTTLLGESTGADSLYMDVRSFSLPSKKGEFILPLKVYRGRKRGHNEPYTPDLLYTGPLDQATLIAYIEKWRNKTTCI